MRRIIIFFCAVLIPQALWADIASTQYVQENISHKVDISANANQTMAGSYTVSGTLIVPTPPLPSAQ